MTRLPQRRTRPKMNVRQSAIIRCPAHLAHIRRLECAIFCKMNATKTTQHECEGHIEAAHVRTGTDGGTGIKPSDSFSIPLCQRAHRHQHQIGESAFEACWSIDMKAIAAELWKRSPAGIKWRRDHS